MAFLEAKSLSFAYPESETYALENINFGMNKGDFIVVMGATGSGKSTLLRLLKKEIAPYGKISGIIESECPSISFVSQNPDVTFVSENVRGELAFALENQQFDSDKIAVRIGETASFFNLSHLLDKKIAALSGGERAVVAIAAAMITECDLLILDEPLAQLDPKAANQIINLIKRVNDELGVSIIMSSHISDGIIDKCDKLLILDSGKNIAFDTPDRLAKDSTFAPFFPIYTYMFASRPLTVKSAILCEEHFSEKSYDKAEQNSVSVSLKNITFAYGKKEKDVLSNLSFCACSGEIHSIIGANGSGKTTLLKVISNIKKAYCGKVKMNGKAAYMPQDVRYLFTKDTVADEIDTDTAENFGLECFLSRHPYDLSGGQMQKLALAILSKQNFDILILDEPTKALDNISKSELASYLKSLKSVGKTVILASHDLDFVGDISDRVSFLSDGMITITGDRRDVLSSLHYYTTQIHRITKLYLKNAVSAEDLE